VILQRLLVLTKVVSSQSIFCPAAGNDIFIICFVLGQDKVYTMYRKIYICKLFCNFVR